MIGRVFNELGRRLALLTVLVCVLAQPQAVHAQPPQCSPALLVDRHGTVLGQATELAPNVIQARPCQGGGAEDVAYVVVGGEVYEVAPNELVTLP